MSKSDKVSIIIPMYNSEAYIYRAIRSILAQTYENIEVIVVDDGSTDKSVNIVKKEKLTDARIRLYSVANRGVSAARNYGIDKATGKYIFFMDSDDEIEESVIEQLVLRQKAKLNTLVSCRAKSVNRRGSNIMKRNDQYSKDDIMPYLLSDRLQGYVWGYLFERDKCKKFNEKIAYCEDMVFLVHYITDNNIKSIEFIDSRQGLYIYHRDNSQSTTGGHHHAVRNIDSIKIAMEELDNRTNHKYTASINNRKIELIEYELSRSSWREVKMIAANLSSFEYKGDKRRYRVFSKIINNKNTLLLRLYYSTERVAKKIVNKD